MEFPKSYPIPFCSRGKEKKILTEGGTSCEDKKEFILFTIFTELGTRRESTQERIWLSPGDMDPDRTCQASRGSEVC